MQPYLLNSCSLNFFNASKNIDLKQQIIEKIYLDETQSNINWDDKEELEESNFSRKERANSSFYNVPTFMQNAKELKSIQKEFTNKIYQNNKLTLFKITKLKLTSKQDESLNDFKIRIQDRLNEAIDENIEKLQVKYEKEKTLEIIDAKIAELLKTDSQKEVENSDSE